MTEKFKPTCQLVGQDGNVFVLLGIATRTLKEHGMRQEADELYDKVTKQAASYDEALALIMKYVDVC